MKINKSKFQRAVHLGLLVMIFVLLCVNFRSNLTIYHAGAAKRKALTVDLNKAALSIGRTVQKENITSFNDDQRDELERKHELSGLILISEQSSGKPSGSLDWLLQKARDSILIRQGSDVDGKAGLYDPRQLVRVDSHEYYYLLPFYGGTRLLVVARDSAELAYLEDSSQTLIIVNIVAVLLIIVLYLLLFRVILSPFKKIKRQAVIAGRDLSEEFDDVEMMVDDYRKRIWRRNHTGIKLTALLMQL